MADPDNSLVQNVELHSSTGRLIATTHLPRYYVAPRILEWNGKYFTVDRWSNDDSIPSVFTESLMGIMILPDSTVIPQP